MSGDIEALQAQLPRVVDLALTRLNEHKQREEAVLNERLNAQMAAMDALKQRHIQQLELALSASTRPDAFKAQRWEERMSHIERIFKDYEDWLEETQTTEQQPYVQVIAAFTGQQAG